MAEEKVSVIVPVYNVEKYLRRCLDSIINQTYQNLEIILVDDGSPDKCGAICDEYAEKDDRIVVIHKPNGGVSSARNVAIKESTGKYIVFIDSDDFVLPNYIAHLMSAGNRDYVAAGCYVQNKQNEWSEWRNHPQKTSISQVKSNPELINTIPTGTVWARRYKRELIVSHSLSFHSDITRGEDTLFNCCYLKSCETISVIDAVDYMYQYNSTSATSKLNIKLFRWSMESIFAIGEIIGTDNPVFFMRVWENAILVCNNYLSTAGSTSFLTKLGLIKGVFEVCHNTHVRQSLIYAKKNGDTKKAFLVQFYLYPFLLFLYSVYSEIHSFIKKG